MLVDAESAETTAAANSPAPRAPKEVKNLQSAQTKRESTERRRRQSGNQTMRGERRDAGVSDQSLLAPHSVAFLMPLLYLCLNIGAHASPCSRTSLSRLQRHLSLALFSPSLLPTPCAPPAHARICIASLFDLLSTTLLCTNGADLPHLVRTRPPPHARPYTLSRFLRGRAPPSLAASPPIYLLPARPHSGAERGRSQRW